MVCDYILECPFNSLSLNMSHFHKGSVGTQINIENSDDEGPVDFAPVLFIHSLFILHVLVLLHM